VRERQPAVAGQRTASDSISNREKEKGTMADESSRAKTDQASAALSIFEVIISDESSRAKIAQILAAYESMFEAIIRECTSWAGVRKVLVSVPGIMLSPALLVVALIQDFERWVGNASKRLLGLDTSQLILPGGVDYSVMLLDPAPLPSLADEYPALSETVRSHKFRFRLRGWLRASVYIFFYFVFFFSLLVSLARILSVANPFQLISVLPEPFQVLLSILAIVLCAVFWIIIARLLQRIVGPLLTRFFADSACVAQILHLLVDLQNEDALISKRKKTILRRVDDLARMTLVLALAPKSRDEATQRWVWKHFKEMELFIRKRERWIMVPSSSTLASLRRDFLRLAPIYITRQYGVFEWENLYREPGEDTSDWKDHLLKWLKTLVGFIIPLALMGLYLWNPDLFPAVQFDAETVGLVFVAWLLLGLDVVFDLGVVSGLVELAKGIKDLK
jgi:hypothetical protein